MVPDNFLGLDISVVTCVDKYQDFYADTQTDFYDCKLSAIYVDMWTDFVYFSGLDISEDFCVDIQTDFCVDILTDFCVDKLTVTYVDK